MKLLLLSILAASLSIASAAVARITSGSSLPGACTPATAPAPPNLFWLITGPAGQNVYGCTSTNTWTLEGGTGGGVSNPLTTLGDIFVGGAAGAPARLPGGALDTVLQGGGAGTLPAYGALADCGDATHATNYKVSTHAWGCQTIAAGGAPSWAAMTDGQAIRTSATVVSFIYDSNGSPFTNGIRTQFYTATQTITLAAGSCVSGGMLYLYWDPVAAKMKVETNSFITPANVTLAGANLVLGGTTGDWVADTQPQYTIACVADNWLASPFVNYRGYRMQRVTTGVGMLRSITADGSLSFALSAPNTRRNVPLITGANNGPALVAADLGPQDHQFYFSDAATILQIMVSGDAGGVPSIIIGRNRAGTVLNLTSAALSTAAAGGLACSSVAGGASLDGGTTCSATLQNTAINPGDWLELVSGTPVGAKRQTTVVTFSIN